MQAVTELLVQSEWELQSRVKSAPMLGTLPRALPEASHRHSHSGERPSLAHPSGSGAVELVSRAVPLGTPP